MAIQAVISGSVWGLDYFVPFLDGRGSRSDSGITAYAWTLTSPARTYTFATATVEPVLDVGTYSISLVVTDHDGATDEATGSIQIHEAADFTPDLPGPAELFSGATGADGVPHQIFQKQVNNNYLTVTYDSSDAVDPNGLVIYAVDDAEGHIQGVSPLTDLEHYLALVAAISVTVFPVGTLPGASVKVPGIVRGTYFAFGFPVNDVQSVPTRSYTVYGDARLNPDLQTHSLLYQGLDASGLYVLAWEDTIPASDPATSDFNDGVFSFTDVAATAGPPPPLRLKQRDDTMGLVGHARLPLRQQSTSTQSASSRVLGRNTYT